MTNHRNASLVVNFSRKMIFFRIENVIILKCKETVASKIGNFCLLFFLFLFLNFIIDNETLRSEIAYSILVKITKNALRAILNCTFIIHQIFFSLYFKTWKRKFLTWFVVEGVILMRVPFSVVNISLHVLHICKILCSVGSLVAKLLDMTTKNRLIFHV